MTWTAFSNLTNPTGPKLDDNLATLGANGVLPCTVGGSANAITLTPDATQPPVSAYGNYMRFSGVALSTNSGSTTAKVGSLAALNVYRDTVSGPVVLVGGEIPQNCAFSLIYDSTLNSNAGGFHLGNTVVNGATITPAAIVIGLPSVSVNSTLTAFISGAQSTVAFTVVPANSTQEQNIIAASASVGDAVLQRFMATPQTNMMFMPYVKAAGTVTLRAANPMAASIAAFTVTLALQLLRSTA
jgi:hypothetical protein